MKKIITFVSFVIVFGLGVLLGQHSDEFSLPTLTLPNIYKDEQSPTLKKVVINEAVHTLLYLPLYHAQQKEYFKDEGLDVEIVTGGTATNSFASMISGNADFSQADPMYVPISREKGAETKVVAQVVGRIAVWGSTLPPDIKAMDASTLQGKSIATHPRPMTAYTYTLKAITDAGLIPDKDVNIIQSKPGTELIPFFDKKAEFVMTVEPNTSIAETKGAHIVS